MITASTARDGLAQFHQENPDLVLLDIMLPDGEGYDICKQIRAFVTFINEGGTRK